MSYSVSSEVKKVKGENYAYLEALLQQHLGGTLSVVKCTVSNLVQSGKNFRSYVLEINARVRQTENDEAECLHLVAKTLPTQILQIFKKIDWVGLFEKEIFMYTNIIPFYSQMELENGFVEGETILNMIPKLYAHDTVRQNSTNDVVLLMENLRTRGYYVLEQKIGLNFQHASMALRALARFHALGFVAKKKRPAFFDAIKRAYGKPDYDHCYVDFMSEQFVESLKNEPRFDKYASRVGAVVETQRGGWRQDRVTSELWSSVVHYDYWTNNIMFHRDDQGQPDGVKLIDFQTYCVADVFLDLAYFLGTSLSDDVEVSRIGELIDAYYCALISTLKKLNVDASEYSRSKFEERLKALAARELLHCALVLNFISADAEAPQLEFQGRPGFFAKIMRLLNMYEAENWLC